IDRFQDRVGGVRRWHEEQRGISPGLGHRLGDRVEDRPIEMGGPALARRHAGHDVGAIGDGIRSVKGRLLAGETLDQDLSGLVDENGHYAASLTRATMRAAASSKVRATVIGRLDFSRMARPSSTLVPSRRTTRGLANFSSRIAMTSPSAIALQRIMPPKMLTR